MVFVSHCLLNQNTRYPGGAVCPGVVVDAIAPYLADGAGIVQMVCPEQRTWGGVSKRHLLRLLDGHVGVAVAATLVVRVQRCSGVEGQSTPSRGPIARARHVTTATELCR